MPKLPTNMIKRKNRPGYYYRRMVNGRITFRSLGSDYTEARRLLRQWNRSDTPPCTLTVREAADRWLSGYVATSRNRKGQNLARARVEQWLKPALGHFLLGKLTSEHVRGYRLHLEKQGKSPQTVRHLLSDLRCFLIWCEDCGLVIRSPFPRRIMPKIQEQPPDRLTDGELEAVVALPDPYGFVCRFLAGTGLRWAEGCRSQASDVQSGFLVVSGTKSGKVRRVPIPPALLAEVRRRVGRLVSFAVVSPGSFSKVVRRLTGISGFHPHQLRHTFACRWLEQGGSLAALQQMLGHASVVTTQRYAKLTDNAVRAEAERISGRL